MRPNFRRLQSPEFLSKNELKFNYFRVRLDHTVEFTHEATRNIYLVNGAVLAIAGFISTPGSKLGDAIEIFGPSVLLLVLSIINAFHSLLLFHQGKWYRELDVGFAKVSGVDPRPSLDHKLGTHRVYILLHGVLATILLLSSGFMFYNGNIKYDKIKYLDAKHGKVHQNITDHNLKLPPPTLPRATENSAKK